MNPLFNVIQGQEVPHAPLNVRTPFVRIPLWIALTWWCLKGVGRLVRFACRHWYITGPALVLGGLWGQFGWQGPAVVGVVLAVVCTAWGFYHRPSFVRWCWWPVLSIWRRAAYRRRWLSAMTTAGLTVTYNRRPVVPILRRVRCRGLVDVLTVRMVSGQIPDDYAAAGERLAHTFGARSCRVTPGKRPDLVVVTLRRGDPLGKLVAPLPVPALPDFARLPVAMAETGILFLLCLFGTQVLVVGATGAGKGSVIWSLVRAVAAGVRTGLVQLWGIDPKGGVELGIGASLFARFACDTYPTMVELLEEAADTARERAARLSGEGRQLAPSTDEPLIILIIDELANLTAYLTDRQLKERVKAALSIILSQGRAVGVHVVACLQDPRKEVLPFRNLFPTRIALRLSEASEVDMVLGDGMRDRGALCDRIAQSTPGVGYVVNDGETFPERIRFPYLSDDDIRDMAHRYGRLRVIDGDTTDHGDQDDQGGQGERGRAAA